MPRKIDATVLDELRAGCERPEDLLGDGGLMQDLERALMQRMLGAELTEHLGHEHGAEALPVQADRRDGVARKTVKGDGGAFELEVPRDRDGSFEPRLVAKGRTRIDGIDGIDGTDGIDEKIVAMCARGMSVRDIRGQLEALYGLEVSPELVLRVTDAVLDEVREWRSRALDALRPVVIFDAARG
jgi:transposase-like protein